MGIKQCRPVW